MNDASSNPVRISSRKHAIPYAVAALIVAQSLWSADLAREFASPPDSARMWTWWFWLGDKVDEASITADLEALKAQGMAGVTVYSLSGPGVPGKGPDYMSPPWRALFQHTLKEAERLGLGLSTMLCSGWNAGGPWVQPERACKRHVHSELTLAGPRHFQGRLPQPSADKRLTRTNIDAYKKDSVLLDSGLLGPVTLQVAP